MPTERPWEIQWSMGFTPVVGDQKHLLWGIRNGVGWRTSKRVLEGHQKRNVPPWVERNPRCRDKSIVYGTQISPSRAYIVIVSVPLFFSRFSTWIRFAVRKYRGCGHAVDRPVDGVESRFGCSPLLYHDYRPVSSFRGHDTKVLSEKNISPSFEDTEHKETCVPSLSGQRGGTKNVKRIYRALFTVTLFVLYCISYRTQMNCGVLLETSISSHVSDFCSLSLSQLAIETIGIWGSERICACRYIDYLVGRAYGRAYRWRKKWEDG